MLYLIKNLTGVGCICLLLGMVCCKGVSNDVTLSEQEELRNHPKYNILFFLADDQRSRTIRHLGNHEVQTPFLDKLASNGVAFNNAYIMGAMSGAVCAPSRAMLMTGRSLFNIMDPSGETIDKAHVTLPKVLENAGYHTFHIGKWHNGREAFSESFSDGSKIFFGGMHDQYFVPTYEYNAQGDYSKEMLNPSSKEHSSKLYADAGIEFIENYNSKKPFFLNIAFQAPHDPRKMPQRYLDMYDPDSLTLPSNFQPQHPFDNGELDIRDEWLAGYPRTSQEIKANIASYYAMITHLDDQIGRVLTSLEKEGLMENTIVVFAGDNGLAVGQHGLMGKQNLYQHSINVPLIFMGPDIPKGKTVNSFSYLFDIFPTLLDLNGISLPPTVGGKSLKPVLMGEQLQVRESMFYAYKNFQRSVRKDQWKLIKYNVNGNVITQLFDLNVDPYETTNLADNDQYQSELYKMNNLLQEMITKNNDKVQLNEKNWGVPILPAWKDNVDADRLAYLKNLAKKERALRGF